MARSCARRTPARQVSGRAEIIRRGREPPKLQETNAQLRRSNLDLETSREEALAWPAPGPLSPPHEPRDSHTHQWVASGMIGLTLIAHMNNAANAQQLTIAYDFSKVLVTLLNEHFSTCQIRSRKACSRSHSLRTWERLLRDTANLLSQNAGKQDVEFTCRIDPLLARLLLGLDRPRVRRIVSNLLSNALKLPNRVM